jgi:7-cyano-7-deazaguanine reductase
MNNQNEILQIAGKHLGKVGGEGYKDVYDKELLVRVPRVLNREAYGIDENNLPFSGYDVWNCYEVSAITKKGRPISGMLKLVYSSDSKYHVESKSIKLYLNSLNMTPIGNTREECIKEIETTVSRDLSELLETEVTCKLHTEESDTQIYNPALMYASLDNLVDLDKTEFDTFKSDASQLKIAYTVPSPKWISVKSDLLRSNCRVTNQPDWGDILIDMKTVNEPDYESLAKYIVSHRQVSHFHEEICEMCFTHLMEAYKPEELTVTCLYTRRGGLDINPTRTTSKELISPKFTDVNYINKKTLRQ